MLLCDRAEIVPGFDGIDRDTTLFFGILGHIDRLGREHHLILESQRFDIEERSVVFLFRIDRRRRVSEGHQRQILFLAALGGDPMLGRKRVFSRGIFADVAQKNAGRILALGEIACRDQKGARRHDRKSRVIPEDPDHPIPRNILQEGQQTSLQVVRLGMPTMQAVPKGYFFLSFGTVLKIVFLLALTMGKRVKIADMNRAFQLEKALE